MPVIDPIAFQQLCWPNITIWDKQREICYSVMENDSTIVVAGNQLGKDFISAFIVLWWMCSRSPARVLTSSPKYEQLNDVLWGEIRNFLESSAVPLPLHVNHMKIRQTKKNGDIIPLAELTGQVVRQGESILGRHLPKTGTNGDLEELDRTLVVFDEGSAIDTDTWEKVDTWAHSKLVIGNPLPCNNFFRKAVRDGDIPREDGNGFYQKIIKITADDSPNVKLAKAEIRSGKKPSNTILIPGVKDFRTYQKHRKLWDKVWQCIGLDAEFYEGADLLMFPPDWINQGNEHARNLQEADRVAVTIGIDPAEGGDSSCWSICDYQGLIELISRKTEDTNVIPLETIRLMREYRVKPENVLFDRGGGGKQHADRLRAMGYNVRTVGFGESVTPERTRGSTGLQTQKEHDEEKYAYKNRRAEMYHLLRQRLDPEGVILESKTLDFVPNRGGHFIEKFAPKYPPFAIPEEYTELRKQMAPIPLTIDNEGRYTLLPKNKPNAKPGDQEDDQKTLTGLLGCSPDELDSLVLAVYGLTNKKKIFVAGAG